MDRTLEKNSKLRPKTTHYFFPLTLPLNLKRLGKSEIDLVNIFIEGLTKIIQLEQKLEKGEDIAADIASVSSNRIFVDDSQDFSVGW